jgi:hypothetical protein
VTVTVSRCCEGCGGPLGGRRPQAQTCSPACRQRVSRLRRKCDSAPPAPSVERVLLDAASRAWLRAEVDRRRRKQLATQVLVDRALFANDAGRVLR